MARGPEFDTYALEQRGFASRVSIQARCGSTRTTKSLCQIWAHSLRVARSSCTSGTSAGVMTSCCLQQKPGLQSPCSRPVSFRTGVNAPCSLHRRLLQVDVRSRKDALKDQRISGHTRGHVPAVDRRAAVLPSGICCAASNLGTNLRTRRLAVSGDGGVEEPPPPGASLTFQLLQDVHTIPHLQAELLLSSGVVVVDGCKNTQQHSSGYRLSQKQQKNKHVIDYSGIRSGFQGDGRRSQIPSSISEQKSRLG